MKTTIRQQVLDNNEIKQSYLTNGIFSSRVFPTLNIDAAGVARCREVGNSGHVGRGRAGWATAAACGRRRRWHTARMRGHRQGRARAKQDHLIPSPIYTICCYLF